MSTPDTKSTNGNSTGHIGPSDEEATELVARRAADAAVYANATHPTRTTSAVSWIGWHITEIGSITLPALLGCLAWEGFYVVSALVAVGWVANELRGRREHAKRRAARQTLAAGEKSGAAVSDEDGEPA